MAARVPLEDLVRQLTEELKNEVYDFVGYLIERQARGEDHDWAAFSLGAACRGFVEEPSYAETDLKERWR
ncbi:MAG: hypothetical protein ABIF09_02245 [Gemmatimonadota bacterium]